MDQDSIRKSAHAKWEAEGRPEGQHDRHWFEAEQEASPAAVPQTWSADHGGGVSPPTSTGSVEDEQVVEPSNDWPAVDAEPDAVDTFPSSVDNREVPAGGAPETFGNGSDSMR